MADPAHQVAVFLGPSARRAEAERLLDARYLPPARHGDVFGEARRGTKVIALIDGRFDTVLSVWHKEILWALSEGVTVYGAASTGALRAVELAAFGMRGVGSVFDAYRSGVLEDDDEVAVAHGGPEEGWRPLSDAMVDVRATLASAVAEGVIGHPTADQLTSTVKAEHYARRSLAGILAEGDAEHARLGRWLPDHRVRAKHDDAVLLLETIAGRPSHASTGRRQGWTFAVTEFWEAARRGLEVADGHAELEPGLADSGDFDHSEDELLLDEVRLRTGAFGAICDDAVASLLSRRAMEQSGAEGGSWAADDALREVQLANDLLDVESVDRWLAERGLDRTDLGWVAQRTRGRRWVRATMLRRSGASCCGRCGWPRGSPPSRSEQQANDGRSAPTAEATAPRRPVTTS